MEKQTSSESFISKIEHQDKKAINAVITLLDGIYIKRDDGRSILDCFNKQMENIKKGFSIIVFPEGTRVPGDEFKQFQPACLKVAYLNFLTVAPITIYGADLKNRKADGLKFKVDVQIGDEGQLFGSVTTQMIADGIKKNADVITDFEIKKGEFVFVVGDSGSGKSTFIKLLLREIKPTEGNIDVLNYGLGRIKHGRVAKFRRNIGVVFQDFRLLKDRNVYENVAFAQRIIMKKESEIRKNVPSILSLVGLAGKYKALPVQLSGGEQQRVALARALVNKPQILLADEPTGNLDPKTSCEIMNLLEKINETGTTVVVVTHNREIVNDMRKRVITLKQGVVFSDEEEGGYIDED